jgi:muramoyltetrapeptide carboxypeptidase
MLTSNLCHDEPYSLAQLLKMIQGDVSPLQPIDNLNEYHCLKPGIARGRLIGGNFSLLAALCGTPYQPDTRGALLFIEDWHESPYSLDRKYQQLKLAGVLDELAGLILCDFSEMEDDPGFFNPEGSAQARTWREFWTMLTADLNIPVGLGFSVGHGAQTATLPIGAMAQWDTATGQLALLDRPVLG